MPNQFGRRSNTVERAKVAELSRSVSNGFLGSIGERGEKMKQQVALARIVLMIVNVHFC